MSDASDSRVSNGDLTSNATSSLAESRWDPPCEVSIPAYSSQLDEDSEHNSTHKIHAVYFIKVETKGGRKWTIRRRFSEFFALQSELKQRCRSTVANLSLPSRIGGFTLSIMSIAKKRRAPLESFIQDVLDAALVNLVEQENSNLWQLILQFFDDNYSQLHTKNARLEKQNSQTSPQESKRNSSEIQNLAFKTTAVVVSAKGDDSIPDRIRRRKWSSLMEARIQKQAMHLQERLKISVGNYLNSTSIHPVATATRSKLMEITGWNGTERLVWDTQAILLGKESELAVRSRAFLALQSWDGKKVLKRLPVVDRPKNASDMIDQARVTNTNLVTGSQHARCQPPQPSPPARSGDEKPSSSGGAYWWSKSTGQNSSDTINFCSATELAKTAGGIVSELARPVASYVPTTMRPCEILRTFQEKAEEIMASVMDTRADQFSRESGIVRQAIGPLVRDQVEQALYVPVLAQLWYVALLQESVNASLAPGLGDARVSSKLAKLKELFPTFPPHLFGAQACGPNASQLGQHWGWKRAVNQLNNINSEPLPTAKVHCVLNMVREIQRALVVQQKQGQGELGEINDGTSDTVEHGADDFIPAVIFIFASSDMYLPCTTLTMMNNLASTELLSSEAKYWLCVLESAIQFCSDFDLDVSLGDEDTGEGASIQRGDTDCNVAKEFERRGDIGEDENDARMQPSDACSL